MLVWPSGLDLAAVVWQSIIFSAPCAEKKENKNKNNTLCYSPIVANQIKLSAKA